MATIRIADPSSAGKNFIAYNKYLELDQGEKIQAEYIWIGGSGLDLRSKTKTLPKAVKNIKEIPAWNYDGLLLFISCNLHQKY